MFRSLGQSSVPGNLLNMERFSFDLMGRRPCRLAYLYFSENYRYNSSTKRRRVLVSFPCQSFPKKVIKNKKKLDFSRAFFWLFGGENVVSIR